MRTAATFESVLAALGLKITSFDRSRSVTFADFHVVVGCPRRPYRCVGSSGDKVEG